MTKQIQIISNEIFADDATVCELSNSACTVDVIDDVTVQFEVKAVNEDEEKTFTIAFQTEERSNGMKAYNGYEMQSACMYGYDADEYQELEEFLDYDECIFDLKKKATEISKELLAEKLNEKKQ